PVRWIGRRVDSDGDQFERTDGRNALLESDPRDRRQTSENPRRDGGAPPDPGGARGARSVAGDRRSGAGQSGERSLSHAARADAGGNASDRSLPHETGRRRASASDRKETRAKEQNCAGSAKRRKN